ncbi:MAG: ActD-like protein [Spirochaetota bacterium]
MDEKRVPDLLIEQYVLGELPEKTAREVERSPGFAERVAAIERDNAAFAERYPAEVFARRVENQYEAERAFRTEHTAARRSFRGASLRSLAFIMPGAAAVVALAFVLFGGLGIDSGTIVDPDQEIVRLKGLEPEISVFRAAESAATADELEDGSIARAGDRLQITYHAGARPFGMIVSIDGRGTTTLHYPVTPSSEPELVVGGEQHLPYAYVLDDAPSFERFFFITADDPFSVSRTLEQIRDQADAFVADPSRDLRLAERYEITSVTINKGE